MNSSQAMRKGHNIIDKIPAATADTSERKEPRNANPAPGPMYITADFPAPR